MPDSPSIKPVPNLPEFRYNAPAGRYIGTNGRFVKAERIRGALDDFITGVTNSMELLSSDLVAGEITLAQWQGQMALLTKDVNLAGAALERGGWYNMTSADFGRAGQKIRGEYGYLRNFADEIDSGVQRLDGSLVSRSRLYGEQGRVTYYDFAAASSKAAGYDEERSFLTPSESCEKCIDEAARDWVPIGDLIPIGDRTCLSNCNCYMQYRNSRTGETRTA